MFYTLNFATLCITQTRDKGKLAKPKRHKGKFAETDREKGKGNKTPRKHARTARHETISRLGSPTSLR